MIFWIKRGASLFGSAAFFIVLISLLARPGALVYPTVLVCFAAAFVAGLVCWFFGAVVCDIMIKGLIVDIGPVGPEQLVEGGILQRLHMMNEQCLPGGKEMPFVNATPPGGADGKKTKS